MSGTAVRARQEAPLPPKPRTRGRIHQIAFIVSVPAGLLLVAVGPRLGIRMALLVYAVTLANMFGTSGAYHRLNWSPQARGRMMRLDHSAIFLLIAGTYTPVTVIALHGALRAALLAIVWGLALTMIVLKAVWQNRLRALFGFMYIALGWAAVVVAPQFARALPAASTVLIVLGGVLYTSGAIVLLRHRPDPNPTVFGYHEVWHVFMTSAATCHYAAILLLVLGIRT